MKLYSSRYSAVFVFTLFVLIVPNLFLMTKSKGASNLVLATSQTSSQTSTQAFTGKLPQFSDYFERIYSGRVNAPDLNSHPDARSYRTRLRNAAKGQVNFAGEYILATWGCGTNCLTGALTNARTGQVVFLPGTICCWDYDRQNPIDYRADSALIVFTGLINEQEPAGTYYYELRQGQFRYIQHKAL